VFKPWLDLSLAVAEAQQVIWLRGMKFAAGGAAANREAARMVTEKVEAGLEAAGRLVLGASPDEISRLYRRKVRANRRRLSRRR
jgi:hypothetical protein